MPLGEIADVYALASKSHRASAPMIWGDSTLGVPAEERSEAGMLGGMAYEPAADIGVLLDCVVVVLEVPGTRGQEHRLDLHGQVLSVSGERPASLEASGCRVEQLETWSGAWNRLVELPVPVVLEGAQVRYEDGLLRIELALRS